MLVRDLTKELGFSSNKLMISLLEKAGIPGKKHGSKLTEEEVLTVKRHILAQAESASLSSKAVEGENPLRAKGTDRDREIADELDEIYASLRDIPEDHWVEVKIEGMGIVRIYRPEVERHRTKAGVWIFRYPSLYTKDRMVGVSVEDYEQYIHGGWMRKHMPFVTPSTWFRLDTLFRQYSTYTDKCTEGGEEFNPLIPSKIRLMLRKRWHPPFSRFMDAMQLPQTCFPHWVLKQSREEVIAAWMKATVDMQKYRSDPGRFREARINRLAGLITEVYETVKVRNPRITHAGVADAVVAYAQEITKGNG